MRRVKTNYNSQEDIMASSFVLFSETEIHIILSIEKIWQCTIEKPGDKAIR